MTEYEACKAAIRRMFVNETREYKEALEDYRGILSSEESTEHDAEMGKRARDMTQMRRRVLREVLDTMEARTKCELLGVEYGTRTGCVVSSLMEPSDASELESTGQRIAVALTYLSGDEDVPYGTVGDMLDHLVRSGADRGALVAAFLGYFDRNDEVTDEIRDALTHALRRYVDDNWQRICAGDRRFSA